VLGTITDQMTKLFTELMEELRGIRTELSLLRTAIENQQQHPAIRPATKRPSPARRKPS